MVAAAAAAAGTRSCIMGAAVAVAAAAAAGHFPVSCRLCCVHFIWHCMIPQVGHFALHSTLLASTTSFLK
jgi:hypothetical protein